MVENKKEKKPLLDASGADVEPEDATATAILRRKKKPNSLVVDDAPNDDASVISMSSKTMEKLQLFRGDAVLIDRQPIEEVRFLNGQNKDSSKLRFFTSTNWVTINSLSLKTSE